MHPKYYGVLVFFLPEPPWTHAEQSIWQEQVEPNGVTKSGLDAHPIRHITHIIYSGSLNSDELCIKHCELAVQFSAQHCLCLKVVGETKGTTVWLAKKKSPIFTLSFQNSHNADQFSNSEPFTLLILHIVSIWQYYITTSATSDMEEIQLLKMELK